MENLTKVLSNYNTFIVDGKLKLGFGVNIPCYTGNSNQIARVYPGQPVFIVDMLKRVAPFVGCKSLEWTQNNDTINVKVQYSDPDTNEPYDVEYKIECFVDNSRCDNHNECRIDIIDMNLLKESKFIDADQSRYIGETKYYVVDLFRLGILNKNQRIQLENIFKSLSNNKIHNVSSTIYYTDDGKCGLWDYLKAEPLN